MIASAEIVSSLFLMIILGSLLRTGMEKEKTSHRLLFALVLVNIFGLIVDASSYFADAKGMAKVPMIIVNVLAFSTINIGVLLFSLYLIALVRKTKNVSYWVICPVAVISALDILLIIVGVINGRFFAVEDGHLVYGPWDDPVTIMPVLSFIILLFILLGYSRSLGRRNALALSSFIAFPLDAAIILVFLPDFEVAYLAGALACAIIFTFVRREEIDEAQLHEQIMNEVSRMDTLTGLLNRRGFNEMIEQLSGSGSLGIVFCDLNALKYTNDNFGHAAGDAYIRKFADILRQIFGDMGSICRISGDEFVVLLDDVSEDGLAELKEKLNHAIRENERIASVGYAYGDGSDVMGLVGHAEKEMYADKSMYYKETGKDRRH